MNGFLQDLRYALRSLAKDRGVALIAVVTLALGIGASTVIFSVFHGVLIDSFPYKNSGRLITLGIRNLTNGGATSGRNFFSPAEFLGFQQENRVFEDMVGYDPGGAVLYSDGRGTRDLGAGAAVTVNTFAFYGVPALVGRQITPDDGKPDAPPVFVMNYRMWRTEFNGDRNIVGTSFVLDGEPRTLIGVMPAKFNLYDADVWKPAGNTGTLRIVGRLKPGVSERAAAADLDVIAHRLTQGEAFVLNPEHYAVVTQKFVDLVLGDFVKAIYALLAAVFMLLLIACSNVANLLLARATIREREMALRSALGAGRGRLFRQLLLESFVLATAACVAGCILAHFSLRGVLAILPAGSIPAGSVIGLNSTVLLFALAITAGTTLACGAMPALHAVGGNLQPRLTGSAKGVTGNFRHGRLRAILVVSEVALSIVLMVGAGLMMRSVFAFTYVDLPFNPSNILYARLAMPHERYYGKPDKKPAFFKEVLPRVQALSGVISATETLTLPPNEGSWTDIAIPGKPHTERWVADLELCSAGYFQTLGVQLLRGRLLSESDVTLARHVVVVNETLARQYFRNEEAIGQKIKFEVFDRPFVDAPHNTYFEIVGVVKDFKTRPERRQYLLRPDAFLPASVAAFGYPMSILVRTAVDPHSLLKGVAREVWAVDPDVAVSASGSIEDFLTTEFKGPRFEFITLAAFAGIGLMLVIIGVFSVMGYAVSLQTQQIGVRMALGANQTNILRMVLRQGLVLVAVGILTGLLASVSLTRFVASQVWGISTTDPWTFGTVVACVLAVGLAACWVPARRAARVDPMVALRYE